jgi:demethylmenaquinone methyltransferase/2-methoxy-6-polyprenyl-1,4-benzoquinol methylase
VEAKNQSHTPGILPVLRSKEQARRFYDRISTVYDYLTRAFEQKYAAMAAECLSVKEGETVLEIGFGPGHCLKRLAEAVGRTGKVYGVDISSGMVEVTRRRLNKAQLMDRVELYCADATNLPYGDSTFDATFMSFTLELFDTPEIPRLLEDIKRVLKPEGRIGIVSMSKKNEESLLLRLYEWTHRKWPEYVDCRPIRLEQSLRDAGYEIRKYEKFKLFGLPGEIVLAAKESMELMSGGNPVPKTIQRVDFNSCQ